MWFKSDTSKLFLMGGYILIYIFTSFFAHQNTVLLQSWFNITDFLICIALIFTISKNTKKMRFLEIVFIWFWIGQIILAVIAFIRFDNFEDWLSGFNDYFVLIPVYIVCLFIGIIYSRWILKR